MNRPVQLATVQKSQLQRTKETKGEISAKKEKVEQIDITKGLFRQTPLKEIKQRKKTQIELIPEEIKKEPFVYKGWLILKGKIYAIIENRLTNTTQFIPKGGNFNKFKLKTISSEKIVLENEETLILKLLEDKN
jgi:hypothetical protein